MTRYLLALAGLLFGAVSAHAASIDWSARSEPAAVEASRKAWADSIQEAQLKSASVLRRAARIAERGRAWGDRPGLLSRDRIEHLLRELDAELGTRGATGELYLVGGAVMCLAFGAREVTRDVDGAFRPTEVVRAAAEAMRKRMICSGGAVSPPLRA